MRTGSEVSPSRVFDKFREYVEGRQIQVVMSEVKRDLLNYREYDSTRGRSPEEKSFYYHLEVMQAGVVTPVLLLLLSVDAATRIRAFSALESFLIRRMICRQTTKDYNRLVLELASRLRESGLDNADTVTASFLKEQKAYAREWPSDQAVADALGSSPLYRLLTRGRLRLVLEGAERQLRSSGMSEQPAVPTNLTIEHLMPVGWSRGEWPLADGVDADAATYQRNTLIHSIGNLTLVTQKLNSSMSNGPWGSKREELQEVTAFLPTQQRVVVAGSPGMKTPFDPGAGESPNWYQNDGRGQLLHAGMGLAITESPWSEGVLSPIACARNRFTKALQADRQEIALVADARQREWPLELIGRIDRQITPVWNPSHRGYDLWAPTRRIGFVRFNTTGPNRNLLRVYDVTGSGMDPRGWFSSASRADKQTLCLIDPGEEDALAYVAQVLESAFDQH